MAHRLWRSLHHRDRDALRGVNDPSRRESVLIYFRDPRFLESVPPEKLCNFTELPSIDEIHRYGEAESQRRSDSRTRKLGNLKDRLRTDGLRIFENYVDPIALGEKIAADLTDLVDRWYPASSHTDPSQVDEADQEAFVERWAQLYIPLDEYFAKLDLHSRENGPPLVVLGESGSGKSALLANWMQRTRSESKDTIVIAHFIGSNSKSSDWAEMIRRILRQMERAVGIPLHIPDRLSELPSAFSSGLQMASDKRRFVVIIDGLDQLIDRDGAPDLVWLPYEIPSNVRLILSTLPGRPLHEITKRGWPTIRTRGLRPDERSELIEISLCIYAKKLDTQLRDRIALAAQTSNPLYLRALLEELRLYGDHSSLENCIEYYLAASSLSDLYVRILGRYEKDYEREHPHLVKDAMSLIWAARKGLSEHELLEMLGSEGNPLPHAHWTPIYLAAESSLIIRDGLITFFHESCRRAIEARYLLDADRKTSAHLRLGDYFDTFDNSSFRKVEELPWQLSEAKAWERLYNLYADVDFFCMAWRVDEFEVKALWTAIERNSSGRMSKAYLEPLLNEIPFSWNVTEVRCIAQLLDDTGHRRVSLPLKMFLVTHDRLLGNPYNLESELASLSKTLILQNDIDGALPLIEERQKLCTELGITFGLVDSLGDLGVVYDLRGDLERALALYKDQDRLSSELGYEYGMQLAKGNQAIILSEQGNIAESMTLLKEKERLCRKLGDRDGLQMALGNQAINLKKVGNTGEALELLSEQERICREIGNKDGLKSALINRGRILEMVDKSDGALISYREYADLCREQDQKTDLAESLNDQGRILVDRNDYYAAQEVYREQEKICREVNDRSGIAASLFSQATILYQLREQEGGMRLLKEAEQIYREIGDLDKLQASLGNQATLLKASGKLDDALPLLQERETICRKLGDRAGLQDSLGNQAVVYQARGELENALRLYAEQIEISREVNDIDWIVTSLGNQSIIFVERGDYDHALELAREQERVCRKESVSGGLATALAMQAVILVQRPGCLQSAAACAEEASLITRSGQLVEVARRIEPVLQLVKSYLDS